MKSEILEGFLKVKAIFDTEKKQHGCRGEGWKNLNSTLPFQFQFVLKPQGCIANLNIHSEKGVDGIY